MIGSVLVAAFSYRYLLPGDPPLALGIWTGRAMPAFVFWIHVLCGATALLLGSFQFMTLIRLRRPHLHRLIGKLYCACCLAGGLAAFSLSFDTIGGRAGTLGFGMLATAWFLTTATAWNAAMAKSFVAHRQWMIRSFALTFAGTTLRVQLMIGTALGWTLEAASPWYAFTCWVPNLFIAEWLIWRQVRADRAGDATSSSGSVSA